MSNFSSSAAPAHSLCSVCIPPLTSPLTQIYNMLETAAEQMMVQTDFQAAFDTCNKGLESLTSMEPEDNR